MQHQISQNNKQYKYRYDRNIIYKKFQIMSKLFHKSYSLSESNYSYNCDNALPKQTKHSNYKQNLSTILSSQDRKLSKPNNQLNGIKIITSQTVDRFISGQSITNSQNTLNFLSTKIERFPTQEYTEIDSNKIYQQQNIVNLYRQGSSSSTYNNFSFLLQNMDIDGKALSNVQKCYRLLNIIRNYSESLHKQKKVSKGLQNKLISLQKQLQSKYLQEMKQFMLTINQISQNLSKKSVQNEQLQKTVNQKQQQLQYNIEIMKQLSRQSSQWKQKYQKVNEQFHQLQKMQFTLKQQVQEKNQQIQRLKQTIQHILLKNAKQELNISRQQILFLLQQSNQQLKDLKNEMKCKMKDQQIVQIDGIAIPLQQAQKLKFVIEKQQQDMQKYLYQKIKSQISQSLQQSRQNSKINHQLDIHQQKQIVQNLQFKQLTQVKSNSYQLQLEDELVRINKENLKLKMQLKREQLKCGQLQKQIYQMKLVRYQNFIQIQNNNQITREQLKSINQNNYNNGQNKSIDSIFNKVYRFDQIYQNLQTNISQAYPYSTLFMYQMSKFNKIGNLDQQFQDNFYKQMKLQQCLQLRGLFIIPQEDQGKQNNMQGDDQSSQYQSIDNRSFYSIESQRQQQQFPQIQSKVDQNCNEVEVPQYQKYERNERIQTQQSLPQDHKTLTEQKNYIVKQQSQKQKTKNKNKNYVFTYLCSQLQKQLKRRQQIEDKKEKYQRQHNQIIEQNAKSGVKLTQDFPQICNQDHNQQNKRDRRQTKMQEKLLKLEQCEIKLIQK